jgi:hypothetical protein
VCCNTIRSAGAGLRCIPFFRRYGNVSALRSDTPEDNPLRSTHLCARMTDAPEHSEKAPLDAESPGVEIPVCVIPYTPGGCDARTPRSVAGRHGEPEGGGSNLYAVRGDGPLRAFERKMSKINERNPSLRNIERERLLAERGGGRKSRPPGAGNRLGRIPVGPLPLSPPDPGSSTV